METREIVGDSEKQIAKEWFEELRDMICEDFEKIEILLRKQTDYQSIVLFQLYNLQEKQRLFHYLS